MNGEGELLDPTGGALRECFTLTELCVETGLADHRILHFMRLGLIDPMPAAGRSTEIAFPASVLLRIARMQRLRADLRLNYASLGLVLDLLERVERLERETARRR